MYTIHSRSVNEITYFTATSLECAVTLAQAVADQINAIYEDCGIRVPRYDIRIFNAEGNIVNPPLTCGEPFEF